jgi:DNA-binding PadR family transcriptional regulator
MLWGNFYYSERQMYRILNRLVEEGVLVKQSSKIGFLPA